MRKFRLTGLDLQRGLSVCQPGTTYDDLWEIMQTVLRALETREYPPPPEFVVQAGTTTFASFQVVQ